MGSDGDTVGRLTRLEDRQSDALTALAAMKTQLQEIQDGQKAIMAEIGGAPDAEVRGSRDTIRWRLHRIENNDAAAKAAEAALTAARAKGWTTAQKVGLFLFAGIGALLALLTFLGVSG